MDARVLITANIIGLFGSILIAVSGLVKEKKKLLIVQCVMFASMATEMIMLEAYSGASTNICNLIRNVVCIFLPYTLGVKIAFVIATAAATAFFNKSGLLGWFPAITSIALTVTIDVKDVKVIKLVLGIAQIMWVIYDIYIKAYTSIPLDALAVFTNFIAFFQLLLNKKGETKNAD